MNSSPKTKEATNNSKEKNKGMAAPPPVSMVAGFQRAAGEAAANAARQAATGVVNDVLTMDKLMAKEREIAALTASLTARDREVKLLMQRMLPNWPPKFCCISPVVYHSIESEVPTDRVSFVRACYAMYYITAVFLVFNTVCAGVAMISPQAKDLTSDQKQDWSPHFGVSFVHLLGIVFAFPVWYFPIYRALSTFDDSQYKMALVGGCVALFYDAFMALGFIGYGGCGWLFAMKLQTTKDSQSPFYMGLTSAIVWTAQAVFFLWVLYRVRRYRRQDKNRDKGVVASVLAAIPRPGAIAAAVI